MTNFRTELPLAHKAYVAFVQICKGGSDDAGTYEDDEAIVRAALKRLDELERKALISLGWTPPGSDEEGFDVEPIALSDRRPDKTDCNEKGYCWFGQQQVYGIYSGYWIWDLKHRHSSLAEYERYWLPASVKRLPARTTAINTGN